MLGSGDPTPYDLPLAVALVVLAILLLIGAITGPAWRASVAAGVRRGALLLAVLATGLVVYLTPTTNGIVGAARLLVLWPALGLAILAYAFWAWRARRL